MTEDSVRVIVVDDVSDAAQTLALLLELDANHVAIACDAAQAPAMIDAFAPHCILFDIDMPVLDDFELSKQVRACYENDIVLIAATARAHQDTRAAVAFDIAEHYFIKPVDHKLLPPRRVVPVQQG